MQDIRDVLGFSIFGMQDLQPDKNPGHCSEKLILTRIFLCVSLLSSIRLIMQDNNACVECFGFHI
jgi:hypothetical protein